MGKTIAEVRRINRDRRARQRAAARAAGVPTTAKVNAAVVEANSFAMRAGVTIDGKHLYIDSAVVLKTAVDILTKRWRFDLKRSRHAVAAIVSPRPEHLWPSFVPTHDVPAPDEMPSALRRGRCDRSQHHLPNTPVTGSGHVAACNGQ